MAEYQLSPAAEQDLENIWRYPNQHWGIHDDYCAVCDLDDKNVVMQDLVPSLVQSANC